MARIGRAVSRNFNDLGSKLQMAERGPMHACLLCLGALLMLFGCTSVEFEGVRDRLDISPAELMVDSRSVPQGTVIWGGRVLEIANLGDSTEILILAFPLSGGHVPQFEEQSIGRFVISFQGFLEPMDYAPGRYVSMAGALAGKTSEWSYDGVFVELPVVRSSQIHLWSKDTSSWRSRIHFGLSVSIHG